MRLDVYILKVSFQYILQMFTFPSLTFLRAELSTVTYLPVQKYP